MGEMKRRKFFSLLRGYFRACSVEELCLQPWAAILLVFFTSTRLVAFNNTPVQEMELAGFYDFPVRLIKILTYFDPNLASLLELHGLRKINCNEHTYRVPIVPIKPFTMKR